MRVRKIIANASTIIGLLSWLICLLVGYGMFSSLDAQYVASGKSTPRESFYILVITPAGMAVLLLAALIIFNFAARSWKALLSLSLVLLYFCPFG